MQAYLNIKVFIIGQTQEKITVYLHKSTLMSLMFINRLAGYTGGHSYFQIRDDRTTYSYTVVAKEGALGQIARKWGQHYFQGWLEKFNDCLSHAQGPPHVCC